MVASVCICYDSLMLCSLTVSNQARVNNYMYFNWYVRVCYLLRSFATQIHYTGKVLKYISINSYQKCRWYSWPFFLIFTIWIRLKFNLAVFSFLSFYLINRKSCGMCFGQKILSTENTVLGWGWNSRLFLYKGRQNLYNLLCIQILNGFLWYLDDYNFKYIEFVPKIHIKMITFSFRSILMLIKRGSN